MNRRIRLSMAIFGLILGHKTPDRIQISKINNKPCQV